MLVEHAAKMAPALPLGLPQYTLLYLFERAFREEVPAVFVVHLFSSVVNMFQMRKNFKNNQGSVNAIPNWRSKLRERCRERIKENRQKVFNSSRNLPTKEELHCYVMETIHSELKDLKSTNIETSTSSTYFYPDYDVDEDFILKELEEELLQQEESECQNYVAQYEMEESDYDQYLEELQADDVLCPLCARHKLFMNYDSDGGNLLTCSGDCPLSKIVPYGMNEVRRRIEFAIASHEMCAHKPGFTFTNTPEESDLYLVCSECGAIFNVF